MRKRNYVVGFTGKGQVVYGKKISNEVYDRKNSYIDLLTYKEAQKEVRNLLKPNYSKSKRYIYELQGVYTID
jgi:hypothetical protein